MATYLKTALLQVAAIFVLCAHASPSREQDGHVMKTIPEVLEYGVVVDAGSSGSRARVYAWPKRTHPKVVPNITQVNLLLFTSIG